LTYEHAGLRQDSMYQSSMLFLKDWLYSYTGRPNFYGD